jgi:peptidoglycan/LPS O-acetylase OafA/YrhL
VRGEISERFVVLDGLRGAAAVAVVTVHASSPTWKALLPEAALAVDFFFALSGFVLAHAYGERFRNGLSVFEFVRARCVRFWPMLLAAFILALAYTLIGAAMRGNFNAPLYKYLASIILGLAFLPVPPGFSTDPRVAFPIVGPSYTMFLELSVNLLFALLAARLSRSLLAAIVVLFAGLLIWTATEYGTIIEGWLWEGFIGAFPRVGYSFFAGALVYELWRPWRPPSMPAWCSFLLLLLVFGMPASGAWYELISVFAFFPALILFSAGARATERFEWVCRKIGSLSYGFYIIHVPVTHFVEAIVPHFGVTPEVLDVWLVLLVVAISGVLTVLLTRFYESPFRRVLGRVGWARAATTP